MRNVLLLLLPFCLLVACESKQVVFEPYNSETLKIEQISTNVFLHTSYLEIPNYGKFPCNGMVFVSEEEAIVFDTPTSDSVSLELIDWIREVRKKEIKAVVINHFHVDCLGGLNAFHKQNINSYASNRTIELAREDMVTLPQNGFDKVLELKIGNESSRTEYFGPGHTEDNVVSYIKSQNVLFGGCLIKEIGAGKGNLADANTEQWSNTVKKIKAKYPNLEYIVPGHGNVGGMGLLDYTIELFKNTQGKSSNISQNEFDWVTLDSLGIEEQKEIMLFWKDFQNRIRLNNKERVIELIQFPLGGEWSFYLDKEATERDFTKEDFVTVYNEIFNKIVKKQLMEVEANTISIKRQNKNKVVLSLQVGASLNDENDEFESSRIFEFCKKPKGYKLCLIFHAG